MADANGIPHWYPQYLALRKEGKNPLSEITSIPFMANAFQANEIFLVPVDLPNSSLPLVSTFTLPRELPVEENNEANAEAPPATQQRPLTTAEIEKKLNSQTVTPNHAPSRAEGQPWGSTINATGAVGVAATKKGREGLQPVTGEENIPAFYKNVPSPGKRANLRRMASRLHVLASKKASAEDLSKEEIQELLYLQLTAEEPVLAPWYRHAPKALNLLHDGCNKRFDIIQETATEQSVAVGEADLRRMKRQFSSLKNTFLHYVVKDEFIVALADGLPNGTEEIQLAQFEEEAERTIERLRSRKAQNEEAQQEIAAIISQITTMLEEIKLVNTSAKETMDRLQREMQQAAAEEAAMPPLPPKDLDEAQLEAALAEEAAKARALETQIASQLANLADLEAVLPLEREETEVSRAELADLEQQRAARAGEVSAQATARFASSAASADQAVALLEALGGVKVVHADQGVVEIQLATAYPSTAVSGGSVGSCLHGSHHLTLSLDVHSNTVTSAVLSPGHVDVSDIVEAAGAGSRGADFVVREVRSRLAGVLHRRALAQEAQVRFPGTAVDAAGVSIMAPLRPRGQPPVHVQLAVEQSWPAGDDVIRVVGVNGAATPEKAEAVGKVRVEGRGVVAVLETVLRILEAPEEPAVVEIKAPDPGAVPVPASVLGLTSGFFQ